MSWKLRGVTPLLLIVCFARAATLVDAQSMQASVADVTSLATSDAPVSAGPGEGSAAQLGSEFALGVGDVIHITVWHEPELTQTAVIPPDGKVSLPLAGEMPVAGKTALGAQALIRTLLLKYFTDPKVTVSVIEIHSRQVFITGEVQRPGAYPLLGSCGVLQLIASAGGLTPYAHKKKIVVLDSNNHTLAEFDYASAVKGDPRQGRMLQPGQTVVVP